MEYKGIRYTVRIGTERGRWAVAIHPAGVESSARFCSGCRDEAERQARAMIDRWLERHTRRRREFAGDSASGAERKFWGGGGNRARCLLNLELGRRINRMSAFGKKRTCHD